MKSICEGSGIAYGTAELFAQWIIQYEANIVNQQSKFGLDSSLKDLSAFLVAKSELQMYENDAASTKAGSDELCNDCYTLTDIIVISSF